jgi:hypothetical protein
MIQYSPVVARAIGLLKSHYNDIDIYVEDTKNPNMWLSIIRALVPRRTRLKSVSPLPGRAAVLEACRRDQGTSARRRLYIIDGDFDFLLGKSKPKMKNLYRIRAYCIENLLIHEELVVQIGLMFRNEWSVAKIQREFDFNNWIYYNIAPLKYLFIVYAASHKLAPALETVGYSVQNLLIDGRQGPEISRLRCQRRARATARGVCREVGVERYIEAVQNIRERLPTVNWKQSVSGKDYLFHIFWVRAGKVLSFRGDKEQLKAVLASQWTDHCEPYLARRIRAILK